MSTYVARVREYNVVKLIVVCGVRSDTPHRCQLNGSRSRTGLNWISKKADPQNAIVIPHANTRHSQCLNFIGVVIKVKMQSSLSLLQSEILYQSGRWSNDVSTHPPI